MKYISSRKNAEIKEIIKLHRKEKRKELNKCIVEGWRLLLDAWENGVYIEKLFISKSFLEKKQEEIKGTFSSCDIYVIDDFLMEEITLLEAPPGIMGVLPLFLTPRWELLQEKKNHMALYLEDLQDPGNLGTIFRIAEGVGVSAVILSENTVDPYNYKVIRASVGSIFRLPIWISNKDEIIKFFQNWKVIIADSKVKEVYFKENFKDSFLLILGNEAWGVKKENYLSLNPVLLRIPLKKEVDSLNVSIAASVFLFEAQRQRYEGGVIYE
ncbi:MAG TPA: RNA methyltransferase [Dictyoglomaceae bacterium]|nr:RNA methyltransferase [Dictyoglomaceae bacterium]HOL38908.1 RNA methyltransferase [Dictyoglomaceae bacterium]HOP94904.1 RNA methyltransferase [Dictyoglomaceae bacterium]HPP15675.1 RNA methyltransferase [Dictyoglomaceae bacterium]HPU43391.1 RNA methyltransferase [Dictyoglomaceae bacterium]